MSTKPLGVYNNRETKLYYLIIVNISRTKLFPVIVERRKSKNTNNYCSVKYIKKKEIMKNIRNNFDV